jgi:hypothetical protein
MQLNLLDATVRIKKEQLLSSKGCKDFTASPKMLKTSHWTRFMRYVPLTPMGRIVMTLDLELFVLCECEKYIKI